MAKIIIIDDEPDVIELVSFVLEKDGHQVLSETNGAKGLALVQHELPDLVILDVMMPDMDGYTVTSKLFEQEKTRDIPIIILTAKGKVRELFQMLHNVVDYVGKPFEPAALKSKVLDVLEKKKNKG